MPQTSANVIAGQDAKASDFNKVVADLAEIYSGGPGVPIGGVVYFWSDNTVPLNYKVVDGTPVSDGASPINGLTIPNLIDRFIRGVANANIRVSPVSGGEDTHTLTVAEMPSHNHSGSTGAAGNHNHTGPFATNQIIQKIVNAADGAHGFSDGATTRSTSTDGNHSHSVSIGSTGGGNPFNMLPSYRGLVPLMRIK